jgi:hypothetical protein
MARLDLCFAHAALWAVAANCGCAAQYQTVQVSSFPPGATVRAGDGTTCVTPGTLKLRRNADQVLVASLAGHQTQLTTLRHRPAGSLETDKVHFEMALESAANSPQGLAAGTIADPRVAATGFPPPTASAAATPQSDLTSMVQERGERGSSLLNEPALARRESTGGIQFQARVEQSPNDPLEPHRVPRPREAWDPLPLDFLPPGGVPMDAKAREDYLQDPNRPMWSTRMSIDL